MQRGMQTFFEIELHRNFYKVIEFEIYFKIDVT